MKEPEQYYLEQDFWELEEDGEKFSELENDFVKKYIGLDLQAAEEVKELQAVEEVPILQEIEKIEEVEKSEVLEETKLDRPRLLDILQKAVRTVEKSDFKKTAAKQFDEDVAEVDSVISKSESVEAEQEDVSEIERIGGIQPEQFENVEVAETIEVEAVETAEAEAVGIKEQLTEAEHGTEIVSLLDSESESTDFAAVEEKIVEEAVAEENEIVATEEISEADLATIDSVESEFAEPGEVEIIENEISEVSDVDLSVSELNSVEDEQKDVVEAEQVEIAEVEAIEIEEQLTETECGTEIVRLLDNENDSADFAAVEEKIVEEAAVEKNEIVATEEILETGSSIVENLSVTVQIEETQAEQVETAESEQSETVETEALEIEETVLSEQDFGSDSVKDEPSAVDVKLSPFKIIEAENIESVIPEMDRQEEKIVKSVVLEEKPIDEKILIGEDVLQVGQDLFSNEEEVKFSGITDVVERLKAKKELQFVSFKVCEQEFVLPIDCVQEIVTYVEPARVPSKSEYIAGVTPLRGRITPLIRMDRLIKKKTLDTNFKFIAVCRFDGLQVGLIIHSVATIYKVNQEQIDWNFTGKDDLVCGVVKLKDQLVGILAIDRVIKHTVD